MTLAEKLVLNFNELNDEVIDENQVALDELSK